MAVQPGEGAMVGGFFECLVKRVKSCLKKTLGRSKLSFDELATILVEVEAVPNSSPLFWWCWRASNAIAFNHWAKTFNSTRGTSSNWWLGLWRPYNCYQTFSLSCRSNSALQKEATIISPQVEWISPSQRQESHVTSCENWWCCYLSRPENLTESVLEACKN